MTKYAEIDRRIIAAIEQRKSPLYDREVNAEARWLATQTAREKYEQLGFMRLPAVFFRRCLRGCLQRESPECG